MPVLSITVTFVVFSPVAALMHFWHSPTGTVLGREIMMTLVVSLNGEASAHYRCPICVYE